MIKNSITQLFGSPSLPRYACAALMMLAFLPARSLSAADCQVLPLALPASALSNAAPNAVLTDIFQGTQPGNFGWLTWAGSPSEPTLVTSLAAPGDSQSYVNTDNVSDHQVSLGDWVQGRPAISNSKNIRDALDALTALDII